MFLDRGAVAYGGFSGALGLSFFCKTLDVLRLSKCVSTYLLLYTDGVLRVESLIRLAKSARDGGLSEQRAICSPALSLQLIYLVQGHLGLRQGHLSSMLKTAYHFPNSVCYLSCTSCSNVLDYR